ncbi:hypothetical protein GCM10025872_09650 [Barrientosiimonas endolithica]|uniref:tRNA-specific 2-thiouridylase MnmA-like central domain-containing protein n=1 Tax=Barrientosiimonas endolithica TaxID=1535208 RepID=A0ABN6YP95_9MICO|nr:hypothetical protein GCM10025872_09650 [Barrientosiimonas endolithica]
MATGHYAQIVETPQGRELHRAVDPAKDQSYVLGVLTADQLAAAHFPLGDTTKPQIRAEAAERGFAVAKKPDSHDICFIADGDTRGWLTERLGEQPGPIVDTDGEVVGEHAGAYGYTVGQRRGLGLKVPRADHAKRYVVGVEPQRRTVVVGTADLLGVDLIEADRLRWCGAAPEGEQAYGVQLRAHGEELPGRARVDEQGGSWCGSRSAPAASPPASPWCCTPAPASSGPAPSPAPAARTAMPRSRERAALV